MDRANFDQRVKLSEEDKKNIILMRITGASQQAIADLYKVCQPYVSRLLADHWRNQREE